VWTHSLDHTPSSTAPGVVVYLIAGALRSLLQEAYGPFDSDRRQP
jgi:hypothetical protein